MKRLGIHQLDPAGADEGDVPTVVGGVLTYAAPAATPSPAATGGELLMQDGVTGPPVPLETEARDDWLYEG
jgi:hypothetical protein